MKIYNTAKTQELNKNELDLEKGYLKPDKLFIKHHEAVEAKEAVYDTIIKKLDNGSTETYHPVLTPAVEAKEAYDEYEDIQVYVPYTEEELKDIKRDKRVPLLKAFDTYKGNVKYGIEYETEQQHAEIIAWYKDLLDLKQSAFENIPSKINHYII